MKLKTVITIIGICMALCACGGSKEAPAPVKTEQEALAEAEQEASAEAEIDQEASAEAEGGQEASTETDGETSADSKVEEDTTGESQKPTDAGTKEKSDLPQVTFSTVDVKGIPVTDSILRDAKVTMINFWEPWCGPCVAEMPDLQKLYENYKDKGFQIVGAYTTTDMQADTDAILSKCGTSYPVIVAPESMYKFMTTYVPTTIFVDSEGYLLSMEPYVGSNSYQDWDKIISEYIS